jgi:putative ABC transport system permease protein
VNSRGAPNVTSLLVVKAEDQGVKELDEIAVIMHLAKIQQLVYGKTLAEGHFNNCATQASNQVPQLSEALKPYLAKFSKQPLTVLDYRDLNPFFVQTIQMFDTIFGFVLSDWCDRAFYRKQHDEYSRG